MTTVHTLHRNELIGAAVHNKSGTISMHNNVLATDNDQLDGLMQDCSISIANALEIL